MKCTLCGHRRRGEVEVKKRYLPTPELRAAALAAGLPDHSEDACCIDSQACIMRWPAGGPLALQRRYSGASPE